MYRSTPLYLLLMLLSLGLNKSNAAVTFANKSAFEVAIDIKITNTPDAVYQHFLDIAKWWHPDHSYSGVSKNLYIDLQTKRCFCESLADGGLVVHLSVIQFQPNKMIRFTGGLGPLQAMPVNGIMTWSFTGDGKQTELTLRYIVHGYNTDDFKPLAKAVDQVLVAQIKRLKAINES